MEVFFVFTYKILLFKTFVTYMVLAINVACRMVFSSGRKLPEINSSVNLASNADVLGASSRVPSPWTAYAETKN